MITDASQGAARAGGRWSALQAVVRLPQQPQLVEYGAQLCGRSSLQHQHSSRHCVNAQMVHHVEEAEL